MIFLGLHFQRLQLEMRIDGGKEMVVLAPHGFGRRLGQGGIGLNGFMELFYFPPFLVDGSNLGKVQR